VVISRWHVEYQSWRGAARCSRIPCVAWAARVCRAECSFGVSGLHQFGGREMRVRKVPRRSSGRSRVIASLRGSLPGLRKNHETTRAFAGRPLPASERGWRTKFKIRVNLVLQRSRHMRVRDAGEMIVTRPSWNTDQGVAGTGKYLGGKP